MTAERKPDRLAHYANEDAKDHDSLPPHTAETSVWIAAHQRILSLGAALAATEARLAHIEEMHRQDRAHWGQRMDDLCEHIVQVDELRNALESRWAERSATTERQLHVTVQHVAGMVEHLERVKARDAATNDTLCRHDNQLAALEYGQEARDAAPAEPAGPRIAVHIHA